MTLVEFLNARIAEEEAEARRAFDDLDLDGTGTGWSTSLGYEHNALSGPGYVFTRRWSPERVLAECEAKRRIVTEAERAIENYEEVAWAYTEGRRDHAIDDLRHLAAVYADYPDYQPEWKP